MCMCVCLCMRTCARPTDVPLHTYVRVARARLCVHARVCSYVMYGKMSCVCLCVGLCAVILVSVF